MRVLKFGGTSVADAERFITVSDIVAGTRRQTPVALVLSSPAGITNYLVSLVRKTVAGEDASDILQKIRGVYGEIVAGLKKAFPNLADQVLAQREKTEFDTIERLMKGITLLRECPDDVEAVILSRGEALSIAIMNELLKARGIETEIIEPSKCLLTEGGILESEVNISESRKRIEALHLRFSGVVLMAGFTGCSKDGQLVLLGRNGSDYSAACLAAILGAERCEIWTDVDGVYSCDPRLVSDAELLQSMSYREAMELSYFGAKVLHPRTIAPIARYHIPCLIKNTLNPHGDGTLITEKGSDRYPIKGISDLDKMSLINVSGPGMKGVVGMAGRIFSCISRAGISVALITQSSSEYSICFCVHTAERDRAVEALYTEFVLEFREKILDPLDVRDGMAIISVVGDGMRTRRGVSAKFFKALAQANINVAAIAQGSSERSISAVVSSDKVKSAIRACHLSLFRTKQYIDLILVGIGGVGGALLDQITRQQKVLATQGIDLRMVCLATGHHMVMDPDGIDLHSNWREGFNASEGGFNYDKVLKMVTDSHLINPVIIDCTTSPEIAGSYERYLLDGFNVVTPNKKANTGTMDYYRALRRASLLTRRKFLYETNVGAGLPVIENLQNLIRAGDRLLHFEGILSGSLSYIFGKLDEGLSFSEATKTAKEKGFTEPDPRDDLNGMDVARKLLILARESGFVLDLDDVDCQPALPPGFDASGSAEDFMKRLPEADAWFREQAEKAKAEGKVLRYVGQIDENGHCRVSILPVDEKNALYRVKDGENALSFITNYYQPIPLVLRGYGAGTQVTAAGVFADVLRTLNWKQEV